MLVSFLSCWFRSRIKTSNFYSILVIFSTSPQFLFHRLKVLFFPIIFLKNTSAFIHKSTASQTGFTTHGQISKIPLFFQQIKVHKKFLNAAKLNEGKNVTCNVIIPAIILIIIVQLYLDQIWVLQLKSGFSLLQREYASVQLRNLDFLFMYLCISYV